MFNIDPKYFSYKKHKLFCEKISIEKLVHKFDTPLYIYSKNYFVDRYKEFENAFSLIPHAIFYAVKSNFNLSVIKAFIQAGSGVDVNSEGELLRALKVGVKPNKIILTGVGKTEREISLGIKNNVLMIKAESEEEILLINKIAKKLNKIAPVAIRVNPNVDANSHPYISTGLSENKFGVEYESALAIYRNRNKFKNILFTGIDMHIGSQITSILPFIQAVDKLSDMFFKLKAEGLKFQHFDIGGGIGIQYNNDDSFSIQEFAKKLLPKFKKLNCQIFFEPGRYLTANGGALITKVIYTKKNKSKNFIIVDAAMNDLLRPSIYKAFHNILPIKIDKNKKNISADIVGPICESGDFFAKSRKIQDCSQKDLLSIMSAGAYGIVMSSNYNGRRRPAEILIDGNKYKVIRSRETFNHLIFDEQKLTNSKFSLMD